MRHQKGNLANWHGFGVVSSQPRSDGVPERCKFASLRLLSEIRPWADFLRQRFREGMVSAVVGCQWRSWLHPTCKFAHRRSLPARAPGWVRKIAHPCADGQLINPPIGGFVARVGSGLLSGNAQICAITRHGGSAEHPLTPKSECSACGCKWVSYWVTGDLESFKVSV